MNVNSNFVLMIARRASSILTMMALLFCTLDAGAQSTTQPTDRAIVVESIASLASKAPNGNWGIFVGVNEFEDKNRIPSLKYAVDDAVAQAHLFVLTLKLIPGENCQLALGGSPTSEFANKQLVELKAAKVKVVGATYRILLGITSLEQFQSVGYDNRNLIVVSISSHGYQERNGTPYIIASDGFLGTTLAKTSISVPDFTQALSDSKFKNKLLLIDACRSIILEPGTTASKEIKPLSAMTSDGLVNELSKPRDLRILNSCSQGQRSYESDEFQHGVFTYYFLQAVNGGADPDDNCYIRMNSAAKFVTDQVGSWAAKQSMENTRESKSQTPLYIGPVSNNAGDDIPLAIHAQQSMFRDRWSFEVQKSLKPKINLSNSQGFSLEMANRLSTYLKSKARYNNADDVKLMDETISFSKHEGADPMEFAQLVHDRRPELCPEDYQAEHLATIAAKRSPIELIQQYLTFDPDEAYRLANDALKTDHKSLELVKLRDQAQELSAAKHKVIEALNLLSQAREIELKGDLKKAKLVAIDARKLTPENPDISIFLSHLEDRIGRSRSEELLALAISENEVTPKSLDQRTPAQRHANAMKYIQEGISLDPTNENLYAYKKKLEELQRYDEADVFYKQAQDAFRVWDSDVDQHNLESPHLTDAKHGLDEVQRIFPEHEGAKSLRATIAKSEGRVRLASVVKKIELLEPPAAYHRAKGLSDDFPLFHEDVNEIQNKYRQAYLEWLHKYAMQALDKGVLTGEDSAHYYLTKMISISGGDNPLVRQIEDMVIARENALKADELYAAKLTGLMKAVEDEYAKPGNPLKNEKLADAMDQELVCISEVYKLDPNHLKTKDASERLDFIRKQISDFRDIEARVLSLVKSIKDHPETKEANEKQLRVIEAGIPLDSQASAGQLRIRSLISRYFRFLPGSEITETDANIKFVFIPSGKFILGGEPRRKSDTNPPARVAVNITRNFYLGQTEVTRDQWKRIMHEDAPGAVQRADAPLSGDLPVSEISWYQASEFCKRLSANDKGIVYRLPTEAEWELACRAGAQGRYFFGDKDQEMRSFGWSKENSKGKKQPVAQLKANAWGLYDMHGGVSEWCSDYFSDFDPKILVDPKKPLNYQTDPKGPDSPPDPDNADNAASDAPRRNDAAANHPEYVRIVRGGGYTSRANICESSFRDTCAQGSVRVDLGFRVLREIKDDE